MIGNHKRIMEMDWMENWYTSISYWWLEFT